MHESTEQRRDQHMAKLIQICASQNDLFGLDADGVVYHYNFNTNTWIKLGRGQRDHGESSPDGDQPTRSDSKIRSARRPPGR
jgi:hypothetical protein